MMYESQCGLHLFDLVRAYPDHETATQARALLERHRIRGAQLRAEEELKAAQRKAERSI